MSWEMREGASTEGVEVDVEETVGGELEEGWVDPCAWTLLLEQIFNSHLR